MITPKSMEVETSLDKLCEQSGTVETLQLGKSGPEKQTHNVLDR